MTSLSLALGSTGHQQAWLGQGKRRQELCVSTARGLFWSTLRQRLGTIQSNLDFFDIKVVAVLKQLGNPLCPLGWTGLGLETSPP